MTEAEYRPYKALAAAIVEAQARYYYEIYLKYLKHPHNPYYIRRANEVKTDLLHFSFSEYLPIDIETIVNEIERKAIKGEKIPWVKS